MEARSLLLGGGELLVAVCAVYDELVLTCMLDHTSANELLHHLSGQLTRLHILLELLDLFLHQLNLDIFLSIHLLLLELGLFVSLDLRPGSPPLRGGLQHVSTDALRDYKDKDQRQ